MCRCLVMFSGGLDSTIAVHLLKSQGIQVTALHFVLPFYSGLGRRHQALRDAAAALGVPLMIEEEGDDFLPLIKNPRFGYGRNANPCVDCRIYRLLKAKRVMEDIGAYFIATGEVVGQRPMSQRLDCLNRIEKETGLRGLLLRPLSAKLLPPTIVEERGWVKRDLLLAIHGRGRKEQIAYAEKYGLRYQTPAGGCILTNQATARRFIDLRTCNKDFDLHEFKLIAYGRHFRISPSVKVIVARDNAENRILELLATEQDWRLEIKDAPGPLSLVCGQSSDEDLALAASLALRFSRARTRLQMQVVARRDTELKTLKAVPATDEICQRYRV